MKRAFIIGFLALLLAIAVARPARLVESARSFGCQFHSLKGAQSMGLVERFVLSLVLSS